MSGGGSASASSSNTSGTQSNAIDAETKAFRDSLFKTFGDFTKNIKGFGGDDTATFIAPESTDTQNYYKAIRDMQGGVNPNSAGINTFGRGLMANGGVTGGNAYQNAVTGQNITGGNAYQNAVTGQNITGGDVVGGNVVGGDVDYNYAGIGNIQAQSLAPSYNNYFGGYNAAQAAEGNNARDLTGFAASNPYVSQYGANVIDPTLAEFDYQNLVNRQAARSSRNSESAFGNRASNADAVYQAQSDRDRAMLASGLRQNALQTATGFGMSDADRLVQNDRLKQEIEARRYEANTGRTDVANRYALDRQYEVDQSNTAINNAAQMFNITNNIDQQKYNTDANYRAAVDNETRRAATQEGNINRSIGVQADNINRNIGVQEGNINRSIGVQDTNIGRNVDIQKYNSDANYRQQVDNITRDIGVQDANIGRNVDIQKYNSDANYRQQVDNINRSIGVQQQNIGNQVTGANILSGQDQNDFQRTLTQLGLLNQSGTDQNTFAQRKASEPLDLLAMASSIIAGVPFGGTQTSASKTKSKTGTVTGG